MHIIKKITKMTLGTFAVLTFVFLAAAIVVAIVGPSKDSAAAEKAKRATA